MVTDAQPHASHGSGPIHLDMNSTEEAGHEDMVDLTGNDQASACSGLRQIPAPHHRIVIFYDCPDLLIDARRHYK